MSTASQSREALTATRDRNYRPLQYAAAVLLAALTILYSAAWMYYVRRPLQATQVEIGFDAFYSAAGVEIDDVHPNSPAEKAGLKRKDLIVAINGSSADSASAWNRLENRNPWSSRLRFAPNKALATPRPSHARSRRGPWTHILSRSLSWDWRCCFCAWKIAMHGCWRWYSRPSSRLRPCQTNLPPRHTIFGPFSSPIVPSRTAYFLDCSTSFSRCSPRAPRLTAKSPG